MRDQGLWRVFSAKLVQEDRQMRLRTISLVLVFGAFVTIEPSSSGQAQTPAPAAAHAPRRNGGKTASPQVAANLAQLMRAIMFPNSNVIFFAQGKDPSEVKPNGDASMATDPLLGTFGGWAAVENSSLALFEAANLLTIPGRVCSNGQAVPVNDTDWLNFVQGLRDAGLTAYQAAQSKSNDKMLDAAGVVTTACSNCHDRYRDKPGGLAARCK
jgi:hypothetical protein